MKSKSCVNYFVWNHQYFWEIKKKKLGGGGQELYHRFMYIAPSGDCSLLTLNLPVEVLLRKIGCFMM